MPDAAIEDGRIRRTNQTPSSPMSAFTTYQQFLLPEEAEPYLTILKDHHIPYEFDKIRRQVDTVLVGAGINEAQYELRIPSQQFETVDSLLLQHMQVDLHAFPADYYLFAFTDTELKDVLQHPDEWSKQDYLLAHELLKNQGIDISAIQMKTWKDERNTVLARPEKEKITWIIVGYILIFVGFCYPPAGFGGIAVGLVLWQARKILPNGSRVFAYSEQARLQGKILAIIAGVIFVSMILLYASGNIGVLLDLIPYW